MALANPDMRPSLERYKALDSITDPTEAVIEAQKLIDAPQRAALILRWLLERIKIPQFSRLRQTWQAVHAALRIAPISTISRVLSTYRLLESLHDALQSEQERRDLFLTLHDVLGFLAKQSHDPSVKACLGTTSEQAAKLLGLWLRCATTRISANINSDPGPRALDLDPILSIWSLRKPDNAEDQHFCDHVSVAASRLLYVVQKSDPLQDSASRKRKRGEEASTWKAAQLALERLLARHVFIPGRAAFFAASENSAGLSQQAASRFADQALRIRLQPLRSALSESTAMDNELLQSLPYLLDVAIRCTPAPNPKLRLNERPWVEALFAWLAEGRANTSFLSFLDVVLRRRASIGTSALAGIASTSCRLGTSEISDWKLVAKIIELDSSVFMPTRTKDTSLTDSLFVGLTKANNGSIAETVAAPLMEAFARNRQFPDFLLRWRVQLFYHLRSEVWNHSVLRLTLSDQLEKALPLTQINGLIEDFIAPVEALAVRVEGPDGWEYSAEDMYHDGFAAINVLEAVYHSLHLDDAPPHAEALLKILLQLAASMKGTVEEDEDKVEIKIEGLSGSRLWGLMARLTDVVSLELCHAVFVIAENLPRDAMTACFLASVCDRMLGSSDKADRVVKLVNELAEMILLYEQLTHQCEDIVWQPLLQHPRLLSALASQNAKALVTLLFALEGEKNHSMRRTFLSTALQHGGTILINELWSACTDGIKDILPGTSLPDGDVIDLLLHWPSTTLSRVQQSSIVEAILGHYACSDGSEDERKLRGWFSLLIKHLNPSVLSIAGKDHYIGTALWRLGSPSEGERCLQKDRPLAGVRTIREPATLVLLEEVWTVTLRSALSGLNISQVKTQFERLSLDLKRYMSMLGRSNHNGTPSPMAENLAMLSMVKVALRMLETECRPEMLGTLEHRDKHIIQRYINQLLTEIERLAAPVGTVWVADASGVCIVALLDALGALPDSVLTLADLDKNKYKIQLAGLAHGVCAATGQKDAVLLNFDDRTLVKCHSTLSQLSMLDGGIGGFKKITTDLLLRKLSPVDYQDVLDSFCEALKNADRDAIVVLLHGALENGEEEQKAQELSPVNLIVMRLVLQHAIHNSPDSIMNHQLRRCCLQFLSVLQDPQTTLDQHNKLTACLALLLKHKPCMDQYAIEQTVSTTTAIAKQARTQQIPSIFLSLCQLTTILFAQYRSRLQGRYHHVLLLLQSLLSPLFAKPNRKIDKTRSNNLGAKHAQAYTRLLTLFNNPPPRKPSTQATSLVDESRRQRTLTGQYMQWLLHAYCRFVLEGKPAEGVREALKPGLWACIDGVEMNGKDGDGGMKALSASMGHSERAVLRSTYQEWQSFGKWDGG